MSGKSRNVFHVLSFVGVLLFLLMTFSPPAMSAPGIVEGPGEEEPIGSFDESVDASGPTGSIDGSEVPGPSASTDESVTPSTDESGDASGPGGTDEGEEEEVEIVNKSQTSPPTGGGNDLPTNAYTCFCGNC